ncbi:MAG: NADH-quinone oxidoreductase subunit J [Candidatus Zixiibacteriota bacterium]
MTTPELTQTIVFYFLGAIAVFGAIVVVVARRILRSAIALALTLVCSAGLYILLDYDFIAGVQVLVYVGGIVVLIVFAVMLTSSLELVEALPPLRRRALAASASALFFLTALAAFSLTHFPLATEGSPPGDIAAELGRKLLDTGSGGYVLPFELISLLLLAAVLGGIVIARGKRNGSAAGEREEGRV